MPAFGALGDEARLMGLRERRAYLWALLLAMSPDDRAKLACMLRSNGMTAPLNKTAEVRHCRFIVAVCFGVSMRHPKVRRAVAKRGAA